jgi:hypothetical protein
MLTFFSLEYEQPNLPKTPGVTYMYIFFYGVCRIVIKSVQQCTYFLFSVNLLLVGVNYGQRTMQVCS